MPDIRFGRQTTLWASAEQLRRWGLPDDEDTPGDYIVELNLQHRQAVEGAEQGFLDLYSQVVPDARPVKISQTYYSCKISRAQQRQLVELDTQSNPKERSIFRIWPDFEVHAQIDRSVSTVKADAARRAYAASGRNITWAVVDSGVDGNHPHFAHYQNLHQAGVVDLHRDFTAAGEPTRDSALVDEFGHGTHVAGIIAGGLTEGGPVESGAPRPDPLVFERVLGADAQQGAATGYELREVDDRALLTGVAPACRLVSLKVLDQNGNGRVSNVMRALQHIREKMNADPKLLRVHGVNLSAGYEFNAEVFACGQSPLCVEVDRLVRAGVVVVVAAGNTGFGKLIGTERPDTRTALADTINDPGNARLAITVGATHRYMPHTYGVSYFSSKGPTADGRLKPDLIAPGERITSCATGSWLQQIGDKLQAQPGAEPPAVYVDNSGTSMAAPHVSGAIAGFLSIRQEFIQQPDEVKRIFLESATSLGRDRYYEGHGLVDLMRAIQSV